MASVGTTGGCLGTQACVAVQSSEGFVCIDSSGDAGSIPKESGAGGASSSEPPDASAAGGSPGGAAGDTSVGPTSCLSAQTQFGSIAMGDDNTHFKSGLAARTEQDLFIFNGYTGPDPAVDGGGIPIDAVYVQAFDPKTGLSKGSAEPLFTIPSPIPPSTNAAGYGSEVALYSSAVAPTGQIVLVFEAGFDNSNNDDVPELYAAFLDSAGSASDGAAGLALKKLVHLGSAAGFAGQPSTIWSQASQSFVISLLGTNPWFVQVDKFLVGGQSAGGGTDVVPTDAPSGATYPGVSSGGVGQSGKFSGVAYLDTNGVPALTVLDSNGAQVGSSVEVLPASPYPCGSCVTGAWVAMGGTSKGFVYFYDDPPTSVGGVFVPPSGAAGTVDGFTDGGFTGGKDAGELSTFTFTGAVRAGGAIAVPDDMGGVGGVGVAIFRSNGVSFAYVNADGMGHNGPNSVFGHTAAIGDRFSMTNFAGSFVVSLYSVGTKSTQAVASGCQ
jgi:hypothetical protein